MTLSSTFRSVLYLLIFGFAFNAWASDRRCNECIHSSVTYQLQDIPLFEYRLPASWSGGDVYAPDATIPVDTQETYEGLPSIKIAVGEQVEWWWDVHIAANSEWRSINLEPYANNGTLEFNVKGESGGEQFRFGFLDADHTRSPVEGKLFLDNESFFNVTTEWQHVSIPLKEIFSGDTQPLPPGFNLRQITKFGLMDGYGSAPYKKTFWINNIRITSTDPEPSAPAIRVNQVGYLPRAEKYAYVAGFPETLNVCPGTRFQVRNALDDAVVFSGRLKLVKRVDRFVSGEKVLKAEFTRLVSLGRYYLTVDSSNIVSSPIFEIGSRQYLSMLTAASRYLYYQRQGIAIESPYAGGYERGPGHPGDATAQFRSSGEIVDASQGWYDGGGYMKSTSVAAETVVSLINTYELFPQLFEDNHNIPESGNGISDILDEARWGLDWVLKMQDPVSGGFYDTLSPDNCPTTGSCGPDVIIEQRYIEDMIDGEENVRPTVTTAIAVSALASAARTMANHDILYAEQLLNAAEAGWGYLALNPEHIPAANIDSDVFSDSSARLWAAAELFRATGNAEFESFFIWNFRNNDFDWESEYCNGGDAFFRGMVAYNRSPGARHHVRRWFRRHYLKWRGKQLRRSRSTWRNFLNDGRDGFGSDYRSSSNGRLLQMVGAIAMGDRAIGKIKAADLVKAARSQLNYLLGINPLQKSYVTGYGLKTPELVYSNIYSNDENDELPAGLIVDGPNSYEGWRYSRFVGKCYIDTNTDWRVSNHGVDTNAHLIFVLALINATN